MNRMYSKKKIQFLLKQEIIPTPATRKQFPGMNDYYNIFINISLIKEFFQTFIYLDIQFVVILIEFLILNLKIL